MAVACRILNSLSSTAFTTFLILLSLQLPSPFRADDSYEHVNDLMNAKFESGKYNPDLRPVANQSGPVNVTINFALMSLVQVDDVLQRFTLNGFLSLDWTDERVTWDPDDYGGVTYLTPQPKNIWRPRILLWNTLSDRDLFKDDVSPLRVRHNGLTTWNPGGLFRGLCTLNMEKYPFDEQWCYIMMCPMSHYWTMLEFVPSDDEFDLSFYSPSEGWDLVETKVGIARVETDVKTKFSSCPQFSFKIKRRPTFFIYNIILPVILLAFLNTMVFVIPVDSGEKIGYGITVLLSLSVFLSTVSMMVPQASNHTPLITIYLFVLMIFSVLSVLASIIIVYLHHINNEDESASHHENTSDGPFLKRLFTRTGSVGLVDPIVVDPRLDATHSGQSSSSGGNSYNAGSSRNTYKVLSKHINRVGLITSVIALIVVNIVFMIYLQK